jgi:hypothetical protein
MAAHPGRRTMSIAKRQGLPRYLRKAALAKPKFPSSIPAPVLVRTVAFMPAYQRRRIH